MMSWSQILRLLCLSAIFIFCVNSQHVSDESHTSVELENGLSDLTDYQNLKFEFERISAVPVEFVSKPKKIGEIEFEVEVHEELPKEGQSLPPEIVAFSDNQKIDGNHKPEVEVFTDMAIEFVNSPNKIGDIQLDIEVESVLPQESRAPQIVVIPKKGDTVLPDFSPNVEDSDFNQSKPIINYSNIRNFGALDLSNETFSNNTSPDLSHITSPDLSHITSHYINETDSTQNNTDSETSDSTNDTTIGTTASDVDTSVATTVPTRKDPEPNPDDSSSSTTPKSSGAKVSWLLCIAGIILIAIFIFGVCIFCFTKKFKSEEEEKQIQSTTKPKPKPQKLPQSKPKPKPEPIEIDSSSESIPKSVLQTTPEASPDATPEPPSKPPSKPPSEPPSEPTDAGSSAETEPKVTAEPGLVTEKESETSVKSEDLRSTPK